MIPPQQSWAADAIIHRVGNFASIAYYDPEAIAKYLSTELGKLHPASEALQV
jgi:hypothetical protein